MKNILTFMIAVLGMATVASGQDIRPGQTLQISITGVPVSEKGRLDNIYSVSSSGYINMWKIGQIQATGLTKSQLASRIASEYQKAEIYTSPVFQVFSEEDTKTQDQQVLTVGGQVRQPGQRQCLKDMTLYAAIQAAGGETAYGAMNRVKLYRRGQVFEFDMNKRENMAVRVYPHDTIEVPQTNIIGR